MFRNYDDWKAHNPADEEFDPAYYDDDHCQACEESEPGQCESCRQFELRQAVVRQHQLWRLENERYCPIQQFNDEDLPF